MRAVRPLLGEPPFGDKEWLAHLFLSDCPATGIATARSLVERVVA